ncbi:MAG TPA: hypothetical protein VF134_05975 [Candidatus Dormibacteraeota bacterium]
MAEKPRLVIVRDLDIGTFEPPAIGAPLLRVDTESEYRPDLLEIIDWVRSQTGAD